MNFKQILTVLANLRAAYELVKGFLAALATGTGIFYVTYKGRKFEFTIHEVK